MVTFVTLFLGLTLGTKSVELAVAGEVAAVEVLLGGEVAARLEAPPWRAEVDFGAALKPWLLEAVAYGKGGRELARSRQWVNLPRDPAEARLALEDGAEGGRVVRLAWESTAGAEPEAVRLFFDGKPLAVPDPRRFTLPPHDLDELHFLRAELDFAGGVASVAELAFGGLYGSRVATEMTALLITSERRREPTVRELEGRFTRDGRPLVVRAVERGPAEVAMVVDRAYRGDFFELQNESWSRGKTLADLRFAVPLADDQRLRLVDPVAEERRGVGVGYHLFPVSAELLPADGGLYFFLARQRWRSRGSERLADAVAVAALTAAARHRRRAVVLVLSRTPGDASELEPSAVRRYLDELQVPLRVWSPAGEAVAGEWGEVARISTMDRLERASEDLVRDLDRQWVVWLEGVHLPREVRLAAGTKGFRLLPTSPSP